MSAPKTVAMILQVGVTVAPENAATFLKHFKVIYDQVLAEPECAYFVFGEDANAPGHFHWTEGWTKDKDWFLSVQMNKAYYEPYLAATKPLWTSERDIKLFTPAKSLNHVKPGYELV